LRIQQNPQHTTAVNNRSDARLRMNGETVQSQGDFESLCEARSGLQVPHWPLLETPMVRLDQAFL
jgi:hypothetical protein